MTYANGRSILDADSHVMELGDFLDDFIDAEHRDRLRRKGMVALQPVLDKAVACRERRRSDPTVAATADERLLEDKGWLAVGAFDATERRHALDLFGFEGQLVFATFATSMFAGRDEDLLHAGSRAQNRAVAEFCSADPRLLPVAYIPLVAPDRALDAARDAVALGCAAVMVPSTAAGERSPTHPELHPFWALLEGSNVPFVLHVGGGGRLADPAFHNNAMPVTDHLGGGENVRSKDFLGIHHSPEMFLGALIYDGIFDRFPGLRGACIEQGAGWTVSWMRHLDYGLRAFRRTEEPLRSLALAPSEYVQRHLKFTPFPGEDVGWMIEQAGAGLYMFSTDYPHPEGGKDPLAKFEATLSSTSDAAKDRFYHHNMAELLAGA
jgi:predicted TIM-barrel fold metal-dependent hydrolase